MAAAAHGSSVELQNLFGWDFKAEKAVPPRNAIRQSTPRGVILGILVDLEISKTDLRRGVLAKLALPDVKKDKYGRAMEELDKAKTIPSGAAKKVTGQLDYTRTRVWNDIGRFLLAPLRKAADAR